MLCENCQKELPLDRVLSPQTDAELRDRMLASFKVPQTYDWSRDPHPGTLASLMPWEDTK